MNERHFNLKIVEAEYDAKGILRNLLNLYAYDRSEFTGNDSNSFGVFEYVYLDHYWTPQGKDEGRIPYLLKVNNKLAGFVLVNSVSCLNRKDITHSIAEFFIMRKWRRKGIGKATAFELFNKLSGKWEVSQERKNKNAQIFWRSIINEYTQGSYEEFKTDDKFVQIFKSSSIYNKGAT